MASNSPSAATSAGAIKFTRRHRLAELPIEAAMKGSYDASLASLEREQLEEHAQEICAIHAAVAHARYSDEWE